MSTLLTGLAGLAAAKVTRSIKRKARNTELYAVAGFCAAIAFCLIVTGLIVVLAPYWGWAGAIFAMAGLMLVCAGIAYGVVRYLAARDRQDDRQSGSGLGAVGALAALKMLPSLRMPRGKTPLVLGALALVATVAVVATMGGDDDDA
ncbi:hypothetical protein [Pseudoruegeria sp. SK021]|uniref:hypothetical protein n=1 Tax=Pseudoruegeria sp. SK021 TaxID=1933035 RepID=UPI000A23E07E|nr:hypothetical protein [Pseudoruegeria sp. SK021]OSP56125.1 hypothetical protein BV911_04090 [Pseudoruegeria sp. SK021]